MPHPEIILPPVAPPDKTDKPKTKITQTDKPQGPFRDFLSIASVLLSALLIAYCLVNFVFQSYQVDGPSMRNTLETNDHLIVWKFSKTVDRMRGKQYVPNRGDVIVFSEPANNGACGNSGRQLIKRVVGLPGEHVVYKDTELTIYNSRYPDGYHPDQALPYGDKIINHNSSDADLTLGDNQIFVAGDNRDNSTDSRCFGALDTSLIAGKLAVRILPLSGFKLF